MSKSNKLEMIGWDLTDNPKEFVKSLKPVQGVKYVICEVVLTEEVMKDDAGIPVTNAEILKAARSVPFADSLRKRVRSRGLRAYLDHQILKSDIRDGDGDGKINDGTPEEMPVQNSPAPAKKVGAKRIDALKAEAAKIEFTEDEVVGSSESNLDDLDDFDDAVEHLEINQKDRLYEKMSEWEWEEAANADLDPDSGDIMDHAEITESDIEEKVFEAVSSVLTDADKDDLRQKIEDIVEAGGPDGVDMAISDVSSIVDDEEKASEIESALDNLKSEVDSAWEEARDSLRDDMESDYIENIQYSSEWKDAALDIVKEMLLENGWGYGGGESETQFDIWGKTREGGDAYIFDSENGKYEIDVSSSPKVIGDKSIPVHWLTFNDENGSYSITDKAGAKTAIQVFDNVMKATAAYVVNKQPEILNFTAADKSRQRLYDRLASSVAALDGNYKVLAVQAKDDGAIRQYFVFKQEHLPNIEALAEYKDKLGEMKVDWLVKSMKLVNYEVIEIPPATEEQLESWSTEEKWQPIVESIAEIRKSFKTRWKFRNQISKSKDPRDGDGDGKIFDNTPQERPARDDVGRPHTPKRVAAAAKSKESASEALARTTRPAERAKLVDHLKRNGMNQDDVEYSRNVADEANKLRQSSQQTEPTKADAGGRVLFEAAPDPNDKELTDKWRGLKNEDRVAISREVVNTVMPQVAEKLGVKLSIHEQLGGYLDDTNPSFAATFDGEVDPAKFIETMKTAGFAMSQDSMMGISKVPLEGAEKAGFITVDIPQGADVHETYMKIRSMDPSVQGHTTIGNQMTIVDFTGRHEEIADAISTKLGLNAYDEVGYAAFVDKKEYGYGKQSGQSSGGQQPAATGDSGQAGQGVSDLDGKQQWGDDLRSKASGVIRDRIDSAKSKSGEPQPSGKSGGEDQVGFQTDGQPDQSGNVNLRNGLKVPRNELPQVTSADTEEFKQWLKDQGVGVSSEPVDPKTLKPVQAQVNQKKIDEMTGAFKDGVADVTSKPVMVSSDGYLIDGHHRAVVAANSGKQMTATKVDMPAKDLLAKMKEFPKVSYEGMEANRGLKNYARFASSTASKFKVSNPEGRNSWNRYAQNPGDEGSPNFHDDRKQMHESIRKGIVDIVQPVPEGEQPIAIMFGGGPASGKSSLLESGDLVLPGQIVKVDSDHIKSLLPDYDELIKDADPSLSQRAASFVHEESSFVSKQVLGSALGTRRHTLLDGTGNGSLDSIERKSRQMRAAGHKVVAQYVTVDTDEAVRRSNARAAKTGRFVPESVIRGTHEKVSAVMPQAITEGLFDEWNLWDTGKGGKPVQVASGKGSSGTVHDREAWHSFLKKAGEKTFEQYKDLFSESAPETVADLA